MQVFIDLGHISQSKFLLKNYGLAKSDKLCKKKTNRIPVVYSKWVNRG